MDQSGSRGRRILLVDDDPGVREVVGFVLGLDHHRVVEARNGKEALGRFQQEGFDLVITDYAMPEMNGQELASRLRQLKQEQRILMISGHANLLPHVGRDVDLLLGKPFSIQGLRQAIETVLQRAIQASGAGSPGGDDSPAAEI
jgi:CheY-like chemotaxis protein